MRGVAGRAGVGAGGSDRAARVGPGRLGLPGGVSWDCRCGGGAGVGGEAGDAGVVFLAADDEAEAEEEEELPLERVELAQLQPRDLRPAATRDGT
jgi:hypothetical protein